MNKLITTSEYFLLFDFTGITGDLNNPKKVATIEINSPIELHLAIR